MSEIGIYNSLLKWNAMHLLCALALAMMWFWTTFLSWADSQLAFQACACRAQVPGGRATAGLGGRSTSSWNQTISLISPVCISVNRLIFRSARWGTNIAHGHRCAFPSRAEFDVMQCSYPTWSSVEKWKKYFRKRLVVLVRQSLNEEYVVGFECTQYLYLASCIYERLRFASRTCRLSY